MKRVCHYCKKPGDLRPYGPKGAPVCFPCAMKTPARQAQAKAKFGALLDGAGAVAVLTDDGPKPIRAKGAGDN